MIIKNFKELDNDSRRLITEAIIGKASVSKHSGFLIELDLFEKDEFSEDVDTTIDLISRIVVWNLILDDNVLREVGLKSPRSELKKLCLDIKPSLLIHDQNTYDQVNINSEVLIRIVKNSLKNRIKLSLFNTQQVLNLASLTNSKRKSLVNKLVVGMYLLSNRDLMITEYAAAGSTSLLSGDFDSLSKYDPSKNEAISFINILRLCGLSNVFFDWSNVKYSVVEDDILSMLSGSLSLLKFVYYSLSDVQVDIDDDIENEYENLIQ